MAKLYKIPKTVIKLWKDGFSHTKGTKNTKAMVCVQSLDGAVTNKPNTNPKNNLTLILTLTRTLFPNPNPKIIQSVTEAHFQAPMK